MLCCLRQSIADSRKSDVVVLPVDSQMAVTFAVPTSASTWESRNLSVDGDIQLSVSHELQVTAVREAGNTVKAVPIYVVGKRSEERYHRTHGPVSVSVWPRKESGLCFDLSIHKEFAITRASASVVVGLRFGPRHSLEVSLAELETDGMGKFELEFVPGRWGNVGIAGKCESFSEFRMLVEFVDADPVSVSFPINAC